MSEGWNGLLLLDKPEGPTSHDVVARVRRATGQRRVGHTGTLDPMATGLLVLALGRATRLIRYLPSEPKVYEGSLELGRTTDTDDVTGRTVARAETPLPPADRVIEAARGFVGRRPQHPPAVSARKSGGRRLYALARRGQPVEVEPRIVDIARFDLRPTADPSIFTFVASVSSGTYVRALARDLGAMLGCGGTLASLRRTVIGPWIVSDALAPGFDDPFDPDRVGRALIGLDALPLTPPPVRLERDDDVGRFRHGLAVPAPPAGPPPETLCRVLAPDGRLLGLAEAVSDDRLRPRLVLPAEP